MSPSSPALTDSIKRPNLLKVFFLNIEPGRVFTGLAPYVEALIIFSLEEDAIYIVLPQTPPVSCLDNNSKFGTLALVRQPHLINSTCNNFYQIGKTLISFEIEQFETQKTKYCCLGKGVDDRIAKCLKNPEKEEEDYHPKEATGNS